MHIEHIELVAPGYYATMGFGVPAAGMGGDGVRVGTRAALKAALDRAACCPTP